MSVVRAESLWSFAHLPFNCVSASTRQQLSLRLDVRRSLLSPTTLRLQDWRGLAELLGFTQARPVCLSVCLSVSLSVSLSVCLSVCLSLCLSVCYVC